MPSLEDIRLRDARLNAIIESGRDTTPTALSVTPITTTACVMISLTSKLHYLKYGLIDLAETDNIYCANVLFRVFLEHMLKVNAIFLKATEDLTDSFADAYLQTEIDEEYAYLKSYKQAELARDKTPRQALEDKFPSAKSLSNEDIKGLSDRFRYRELIGIILSSTKMAKPNFITKIMPNYSLLSGFVHGGPSADRIMNAFSNDTKRKEELERMADLAVSMSYSAERYLLLIASRVCPHCEKTLLQLTSELGYS